MSKRPFPIVDRIRRTAVTKTQSQLAALGQSAKALAQEMAALQLQITRRMESGVPDCLAARKQFTPQSNTFAFDYRQDGVSSVVSQYVLKDGVTYEVPVFNNTPGVFVARSMSVNVFQRLYQSTGPMQKRFAHGDWYLNSHTDLQTRKFAFPDDTTSYALVTLPMRRLSFMWNVVDARSGQRYSDELVPDLVLTPPAAPILADGSDAPFGGRMFEFDTPWLFDSEGQINFLFRPLTPVIQPAATDAYTPYDTEDREQSNTVRDQTVSVQVELHGTRYFTDKAIAALRATYGR